ncbi:hypothetical protein EV361DRAFT_871647 [Lentinula raphanica]|nr:hypothetical protein EV361DRAFT_871647 [Lentinula raphanica]
MGRLLYSLQLAARANESHVPAQQGPPEEKNPIPPVPHQPPTRPNRLPLDAHPFFRHLNEEVSLPLAARANESHVPAQQGPPEDDIPIPPVPHQPPTHPNRLPLDAHPFFRHLNEEEISGPRTVPRRLDTAYNEPEISDEELLRLDPRQFRLEVVETTIRITLLEEEIDQIGSALQFLAMEGTEAARRRQQLAARGRAISALVGCLKNRLDLLQIMAGLVESGQAMRRDLARVV